MELKGSSDVVKKSRTKITSSEKCSEYNCHSAKTSLLLPFKVHPKGYSPHVQWAPPTKAGAADWIDQMLERKIPGDGGVVVDLWQEKFKLPEGVSDLVSAKNIPHPSQQQRILILDKP